MAHHQKQKNVNAPRATRRILWPSFMSFVISARKVLLAYENIFSPTNGGDDFLPPASNFLSWETPLKENLNYVCDQCQCCEETTNWHPGTMGSWIVKRSKCLLWIIFKIGYIWLILNSNTKIRFSINLILVHCNLNLVTTWSIRPSSPWPMLSQPKKP